jgi:hypothetical protein
VVRCDTMGLGPICAHDTWLLGNGGKDILTDKDREVRGGHLGASVLHMSS